MFPNAELSAMPQIHKFSYPRGLKAFKRETVFQNTDMAVDEPVSTIFGQEKQNNEIMVASKSQVDLNLASKTNSKLRME